MCVLIIRLLLNNLGFFLKVSLYKSTILTKTNGITNSIFLYFNSLKKTSLSRYHYSSTIIYYYEFFMYNNDLHPISQDLMLFDIFFKIKYGTRSSRCPRTPSSP